MSDLSTAQGRYQAWVESGATPKLTAFFALDRFSWNDPKLTSQGLSLIGEYFKFLATQEDLQEDLCADPDALWREFSVLHLGVIRSAEAKQAYENATK